MIFAPNSATSTGYTFMAGGDSAAVAGGELTALQNATGVTAGHPLYYKGGLQTTSSNLTVEDFRKAFALQRYAEMRNRYGSRYSEYLRSLGVQSPDSRPARS